MTHKPVIITTRPYRKAYNDTPQRKLDGFDIINIPVMSIMTCAQTISLPPNCQALFLTSPNALHGFQNIDFSPELPCFVTGESTAQVAQMNSLRNIYYSPSGDAAGLVQYAKTRLTPTKGPLLYLRGRHVRYNLAQEFSKMNFRMQEIMTYSAEFNVGAEHNMTQQVRKRPPHAIFFFSQRVSTWFAYLMYEKKLDMFLESTQFVCLSTAVAEPLRAFKNKIQVPEYKTANAMMEIFDASSD